MSTLPRPPQFATVPRDAAEPARPHPPVTWFRVTDTLPNADEAGPDLLKCVLWDGTNAGNTEYVVYSTSSHAVDDALLACQPAGGTGQRVTDESGNDRDVVWREVAGGSNVIVVNIDSASASAGRYVGHKVSTSTQYELVYPMEPGYNGSAYAPQDHTLSAFGTNQKFAALVTGNQGVDDDTLPEALIIGGSFLPRGTQPRYVLQLDAHAVPFWGKVRAT